MQETYVGNSPCFLEQMSRHYRNWIAVKIKLNSISGSKSIGVFTLISWYFSRHFVSVDAWASFTARETRRRLRAVLTDWPYRRRRRLDRSAVLDFRFSCSHKDPRVPPTRVPRAAVFCCPSFVSARYARLAPSYSWLRPPLQRSPSSPHLVAPLALRR